MLGICFFTLGKNTPYAPHQEGEEWVIEHECRELVNYFKEVVIMEIKRKF